MAQGDFHVAEIPDYRWEKHWRSREDGEATALESIPDYRWEKHPAAARSGRRGGFRRAQSDLTDYEPKVGKKRESKRKPKKEEVEEEESESESEESEEEVDASESSASREEEDSDNEQSESSASESEEKEEEQDEEEDKKPRRRGMRRSKSDLTEYESKEVRESRRKRRPLVKFSTEDPLVFEVPTLTPEEKKEIYWTKAEIMDMKRDRDREKAEKQREKMNSRYADNSRGMDSIWGSKPNKVKPAKVVSKEDPKKKEKDEKMDNVLDSLQVAMQQAAMITGY
jgi:hypothetical protein